MEIGDACSDIIAMKTTTKQKSEAKCDKKIKENIVDGGLLLDKSHSIYKRFNYGMVFQFFSYL